MGIIIVDEIMVIHLIFSVMRISKKNLIGCQLVGLIGVFATFAGAAYHFYLSELILSVSKVFNPKDLSHLKYHFYAIVIGLFFSLFSIIVEDFGITVIYEILTYIVFWKLRNLERIYFRVLVCNYNNICMALLYLFSRNMFDESLSQCLRFERLKIAIY